MLRERGRRAACSTSPSFPESATEVSSAMSSDLSTAEMTVPSKERGAIRSWLMDMDGVLVHEEHMIPGADRFLSLLRERELPFLVLTNNSLFTRRDLSARLNLRRAGSMSPRTRSGPPRWRRPGSSATSDPGVRRS
jgi:hypothetical protein